VFGQEPGADDMGRAVSPGALPRVFRNSKTTSYTQEEIEKMVEEAITLHNKKKLAAADSGTKVHDWAENFMKGNQLPLDDYSEGELNGINAFTDWFNSNDVKPIEIERIVYSRQYDYVGKTDLIASVNGKVLVCDYKTGKGIYSEAYYQNAATGSV